MDVLVEFAKIILPAVLVLYAVYLTIKSMISKEIKSKTIDYKIESNKIVLPMRLQAYERMCLFLERISPGSLLIRVSEPGLNAKSLHSILVQEIRNELNHNLSQQVYMSDEAWNMVKGATEDLITLINTSAEKQKDDAKSTDLAKEIISVYMTKSNDPISEALAFIKVEVRELY